MLSMISSDSICVALPVQHKVSTLADNEIELIFYKGLLDIGYENDFLPMKGCPDSFRISEYKHLCSDLYFTLVKILPYKFLGIKVIRKMTIILLEIKMEK